MSTSVSRLVFLSCLSASMCISIASFVACASDPDVTNPTADGSTGNDGSTKKDSGGGGGGEEDTGTKPDLDSGKKDTGTGTEQEGGLEAGAECAFNRECQAALRCECDEATGCFCKPGVRGTGKNGVDLCDSGNQCASSVCVEGKQADTFYCSDECGDASDCKPNLPRCLPTFGFPSPICVRQP